MDTMLEMLRKKNPGLPLFSVTDPEFKEFLPVRPLSLPRPWTPVPFPRKETVIRLPFRSWKRLHS